MLIFCYAVRGREFMYKRSRPRRTHYYNVPQNFTTEKGLALCSHSVVCPKQRRVNRDYGPRGFHLVSLNKSSALKGREGTQGNGTNFLPGLPAKITILAYLKILF